MTRKEVISLIILMLVITYGAVKYYTRAFTETKSQYLLDTIVEISARSKDKHIGSQIDSVFAYIHKLQRNLDEYDPYSWISKVNISNETKFSMDPDVYQLLCIADSLYRFSEGAFDPTIKPVWDMWGFNDENPSLPDSTLLLEKLKLVGFSKLHYTKDFLYKPVEMQISFGAIAKGYILDKAREYMLAKGIQSGYINCRSSMTFWGDPLPHVVYIQHPRKSDDHIASFKIMNQSVGTSGDYQQFYEIDNRRYHHIIDPKTGYPVPDVYSVTVLCPSAAWADGLSTTLFLMPPELAIERLKSFANCNALVYYSKDGEIVSLKTTELKELGLNEKL